MLKRTFVAGLLTAGLLAAVATPALAAADVDFGVEIKGSTIALGTSGKHLRLETTNHGTTKPAEVVLTIDLTELDTTKVELIWDLCTVEAGIATCVLTGDRIAEPGRTWSQAPTLRLKEGAGEDGPGPLGKLTVKLAVEGDTNPDNDTATAEVELADHGGDLSVGAMDVTDELTGEPVEPGAKAFARAFVVNRGDRAIKGVRLKVQLPEHVTFATRYPECEYTADNRHVTCDNPKPVLIPLDEDETAEKWESSGEATFQVTVSKDADGPVDLTGGRWTITPLGLAPQDVRLSRSAGESPFFKRAAAQVPEVDYTDNSSEFVVKVAVSDDGDDNGGGTGGGDEPPTLPVTGPGAGPIAGVGGGLLLLGVLLVVISRRRPDGEFHTL